MPIYFDRGMKERIFEPISDGKFELEKLFFCLLM
jgi:hypothetical protein